MEEKKAIVFDIGRFRNTDGPGIRTILFFKGCPLRCLWCSNPFGFSPAPQLAVNPVKCTGCGKCVPVCPQGRNTLVPGEKIQVDSSACQGCGACVPVCPSGARMITGRAYTARELYREAAKDAAFYRKGGGGVTLSGGEGLLQWEVASETLRLCRTNYINTCISEKHREQTGVPNELILENIQKLCQALPQRGGRVIVRLPLIPGCNDGAEDVAAAARFVGSLPNRPEMNLLPYHNLGESKYGMIGETCALSGLESRKGRDPKLLALQELCQRCAPDNRVSLGGDAIALE